VGAGFPGRAATRCCAVPWAAGWAVTVKWRTCRLSYGSPIRTKRTLHPTVGTVKKSMETSSVRWFFKKARHVGEGGVRWRRRYFSTVDFPTAMLSFRNSPKMCGEPQRGFAPEISRIS